MSKDSFDPRFDAAFQPGFDGTAAPAAKVAKRTLAPAEAALEKARAEEPEAGAAESAPSATRPNPFLIALAVISVALIAGGLGSIQSLRSTFTSENISTTIDYMTLQTIIFAGPLAVALGIATGIGVLFIYAISYKNRA